MAGQDLPPGIARGSGLWKLLFFMSTARPRDPHGDGVKREAWSSNVVQSVAGIVAVLGAAPRALARKRKASASSGLPACSVTLGQLHIAP